MSRRAWGGGLIQDNFWGSVSDPRVDDYFLMSSPISILCIVAAYLYFVFKIGPELMRYRQPFDLEKTLVVFNLVQIAACSWIVAQVSQNLSLLYDLRLQSMFSPVHFPYNLFSKLGTDVSSSQKRTGINRRHRFDFSI